MGSKAQRLVHHRLVVNGARAFDAAGRGQQHPGCGIVDPLGQLQRGKAAKHHRMDGPQPGAGQHGKQGLGHHGHIDDHPIAGTHTKAGQHGGHPAHLVQQLRIGPLAHGPGGRAVIDQGGCLAPAGIHMAIKTIMAGVEAGSGEPAGILGIGAGRRHSPVNRLCRAQPESLAVGDALGKGGFVGCAHLQPRVILLGLALRKSAWSG